MNICFVDNTNFQYDSNSIYSEMLRGAENVIINLSSALNSIGHKITIINNCPSNKVINGINWINIKTNNDVDNYDLVISNGDCNLFKYANSKNNILFSHSIQSLEKFIRKKQLLSYLKYRPKICFLSNYHKINRSKLLYIFGKIELRWALDEIFLNTKISENTDSKLAIFISRPDRNLKMLIDIWKKFIITKNKDLKLMVTENNFAHSEKSILMRKLGQKQLLINDMKLARMLLIPGHKAELYCLAAEEAKELCIPLVTLGIGCLSERVEHGITGFIAKNEKEFANYTLRLFHEDQLWNNLRLNLLKRRGLNNWIKVANDLINQIK